MRRRFYDFNNRFRTTKNGEAVVFEKRWICWKSWFK